MRIMKTMDVEALTVQVSALLSSAEATVGSDERAGGLVEALPTLDDSPVRIALAGPFNAGKTMLIGAFLNLSEAQIDELTAATPKTSGVTPYEWEGCILLDLPGTLSGLDEHDLEAAKGVRRADLLVIVTSVELPGEAETDQIHNLLSEEGFANRCIVVVNKMNAEDSDPEVVQAEIKERIDDYPQVQVLFTDAKDYVDSLNFADLEEDDRALLREDSGIPEIEEALRGLVASLADTARLHGACHEVRRVCDDASSLWEPDDDEQSLEVTADRIRLAIANAGAELTDGTDLALSTLHEAITGIGTTLAAAVSEVDGSVSEAAAASANSREEAAMRRYEDAVTKDIENVLTRLIDQLGATSQQWARYASTSSRGTFEAPGPSSGRAKDKGDEVVDSLIDAALGVIREQVDKIIKGGAAPGSPAHDLARKINGLRGITAKAYDHIKVAERLTRYGKRVNTAAGFIAPAVDIKGVVDNIRHANEVKKRREEIQLTFAEHASAVVDEERGRLEAHIEGELAPIHNAVLETLSAADESSRARLTAQAGFEEVSARARALAAVIDEALVTVQRSSNV